MKRIFEEVKLGDLTIKNRLVRSATFERGGAENGVITPFLKDTQVQLAKGGAGLIITGMMAVGPNAALFPGMVRVDLDSFVQKYSDITASIHEHGSKVVVQLSHCGAAVKVTDDGKSPLAPSDIEGRARAMTLDDIRKVIVDFGKSAKKCREAGADGIQIHAAHGYLLSQFLSPYYNKRTDSYGGSIDNRARLLFEVYDEVRAQVGAAYPVLVKINYSDLVEGGLNGDECVWVCQELDKRGISALEVSSGLALGLESSPAQVTKNQAFFAEGALRVAESVSAPVISVGGYRTLEGMEAFLNKGQLAAISMCRPLIREPNLPARWQAGENAVPLCISCSMCFMSPQLECKFNLK